MYDDDRSFGVVDGSCSESFTALVGTMAKVITVKDMGFSYEDREILKNITFQVSVGESLVLLGPSGVGKSTLLRLIAGLNSADKGTIVTELSQVDAGMRLVFQDPRLFPWMSVPHHD